MKGHHILHRLTLYHQFEGKSSFGISEELCLSPDGILRAIIRFPKIPLLIKEVLRVNIVCLHTMGPSFQHRGEGIRQIMYLPMFLTNFSISQL